MNDPVYNQLLEASWHRKLTPAENAELRARLAAHPEIEADWECETGLSEALRRLPDAQVSTNFTSRVLSRAGAIDRENSRRSAPGTGWKRIRRLLLLPQAGIAVVALGIGLFVYERHADARKAELARNVATLSRVAALPDPEILKDFETIRRLDQVPHADEQLLALLK